MDEEGMTADQAAIALEDDIDAFAAKPANGWTDWKDILFKNGSHQNYEVSAQGGSEKQDSIPLWHTQNKKVLPNAPGWNV